jgi:glutaredoxin
MKKFVLLYTMNSCPFCQDMKDLLREADIDYYERDVDTYKDEYEEFVNLTENDYLPSFSILTLDKGNEVVDYEYLVPEESFQDLNEAVEKIREKIS